MTLRETVFDNLLSRAKSKGRPLILDGATGTELDNRGARLSPPVWSGLAPLVSPELLFEIHKDYAAAGAEVLTACTFRTAPRVFAKAGIKGDKWKEAARAAVRLARKAAKKSIATAGSVAPLEDCFVPRDAPSGPEAVREHARLCEVLVEAGVDVLWLETFGTLGELKAAITAAVDAGRERVPFCASVTTNEQGNLISNESLTDALHLAEDLGATAFCVNCVPVPHVEKALAALRLNASIPVGVYANLGVAEPTQDWRGSAYLSPDEYAKTALAWKTDIIGGCCGSCPDHIRALANPISGGSADVV